MKRADFAVRQSLGERKRQEDAYGYATRDGSSTEALASFRDASEVHPYLVVVADGMGGHSGGNVASQLAVRGFIESVDGSNQTDCSELLRCAMSSANECILRKIDDDPDLEGMGTTLVAAMLQNGKVYFASVGDSLLFKFDGRSLFRINADHSMRAILLERVAEGALDADQVEKHPRRNQLLSALGDEEIEMLDVPGDPIELAADDALIFASDGVETLNDERISEILHSSNGDADTAADMIVRAVNKEQKPRQDNCTVAVWYPLRAQGGLALPGAIGEPNASRSKAFPLAMLGVFASLVILLTGSLAMYGWPTIRGFAGLPEILCGPSAETEAEQSDQLDGGNQPIVQGNPIFDDAEISGLDRVRPDGAGDGIAPENNFGADDPDLSSNTTSERPSSERAQSSTSRQDQASQPRLPANRVETETRNSSREEGAERGAASTDNAVPGRPRIEAEPVVKEASDSVIGNPVAEPTTGPIETTPDDGVGERGDG